MIVLCTSIAHGNAVARMAYLIFYSITKWSYAGLHTGGDARDATESIYTANFCTFPSLTQTLVL